MVWGPVGHHPLIPKQFLTSRRLESMVGRPLPVGYENHLLRARSLFLRIAHARPTLMILTMNSEAPRTPWVSPGKEFRCSSVASEDVA